MEKRQGPYGNFYSAWGRPVSGFGMWSSTETLQTLCCNSINVMEPQANQIGTNCRQNRNSSLIQGHCGSSLDVFCPLTNMRISFYKKKYWYNRRLRMWSMLFSVFQGASNELLVLQTLRRQTFSLVCANCHICATLNQTSNHHDNKNWQSQKMIKHVGRVSRWKMAGWQRQCHMERDVIYLEPFSME